MPVIKAENTTTGKVVVLNPDTPTLHAIICNLDGENRELKREIEVLREIVKLKDRQLEVLNEIVRVLGGKP